MATYKYRICRKENFQFELLPNNNNSQPVAKSSPYNTYNEALEGIENFRLYMASNDKQMIDMENIFIKGNGYQLCIYFDTSRKEFLKCSICQKFELKAKQKRIFDNYLAPHRKDLDEL